MVVVLTKDDRGPDPIGQYTIYEVEKCSRCGSQKKTLKRCGRCGK